MHRILSFLLLSALAWPAAAAPRAFSVEVSGHGAPIVLIPGLSCGGDVWRATVDRYRAGHEVHVLTLAGFAGQPAIAPPLLDQVRTELAAYIRAHRLLRPVVIGHSLGGVVALWLAATEPELVGGVVVVDAVPFLPALLHPGATLAGVRPQAEAMRTMLGALTPAQLAAQNRQSLAMMITDARNVEVVAAHSSRSDAKAVAEAMYEVMTTDICGRSSPACARRRWCWPPAPDSAPTRCAPPTSSSTAGSPATRSWSSTRRATSSCSTSRSASLPPSTPFWRGWRRRPEHGGAARIEGDGARRRLGRRRAGRRRRRP